MWPEGGLIGKWPRSTSADGELADESREKLATEINMRLVGPDWLSFAVHSTSAGVKKTDMDDPDLIATLREIACLLEDGGESRQARTVREALNNSTGQKLEEFLLSNELWGGAGSIADESLVSDATQRRNLESLLLKLGRLQLASGNTNPRTEMWVRAFEQWRHSEL